MLRSLMAFIYRRPVQLGLSVLRTLLPRFHETLAGRMVSYSMTWSAADGSAAAAGHPRSASCRDHRRIR
jgi:hypothetical protein